MLPACKQTLFEISAVSLPAEDVGGDGLETVSLGRNLKAVFVTDAVGKGAAASALRSQVVAAFRDAATEAGAAPADACERMNRTLCESFEGGQFATGFYAVLDRARERLSYCRAGHTPALLVRRDGSIVRLLRGGGILGAFAGLHYEQAEVELRAGDRLVLYTDGLTEATDRLGRDFGEVKLAGMLRRYRDLPAEDLTELLVSTLTRFAGGVPRDDVTVAVLALDAGFAGLTCDFQANTVLP